MKAISLKVPRICAVGMFNDKFDIQLQTLMDEFEKTGIRFIKTTKQQNKVLKFFAILLFLPLNFRKYDVIHVQAHSHYNLVSYAIAVFWAKMLRKKIIVMYYGGGAKEFFTKYPIIIRFLFNLADQLVVAGNYVKDAFDNLNIKTTIIPHILSLESWMCRHRVSKPNHLLWVRHLRPEYNPMMLIEVFRKLKLIYPNLRLSIVGTGNQENPLKKFIDQHNIGGVVFYGRVSEQKLRELYNTADVFLNTTNVDNQPVTLLEAMASGCPIVSTNPGGIPDIVFHGENGLLTQPDDVDGMVENLKLLFENEDLSLKLSTNGRLFVSETFGSQNIIKQWADVYAKIGFKLLRSHS